MRRKGKESNMNVALTSLLVVFVCLLSFSVGVISGKGWSDREYKIRHIEKDSHVQAAKEDSEPIGEDMTQREVEMLTKRALEEAQAQAPQDINEANAEMEMSQSMKKSPDGQPSAEMKSMKPAEQMSMASNDDDEDDEDQGQDDEDSDQEQGQGQEQDDPEKVAMKSVKKVERKVSSVPSRPTTPKPTSIEYTVQVAAYKTIGEAEAHAQRLIDKGFPAFPVQALIKGQEWYRVSIGSFKNRTQAIKYEKALKKQAVVTNTFVRKITRRKTQ